MITKKKKRKKIIARGQPRRRVVPVWRSRPALALLALLVAGSLISSGWWLFSSGFMARMAEQAKWKLIAASSDLGFTLKEILVVGRSQTTRDDLLKAIRLVRGAPVLAFDLAAAKQRIEKLPWVHSATIERMLPNTIFVRITERTPLALWQNKGRFALIDSDGKVILKDDIAHFSDLLQVVGDDAPAHAADLLEFLSTQPELMLMVKAAVRVGSRRWNILLNNGINIRLPEDNPENAWGRLAEYDRAHQVLDRDVKVLDLRIPDRLIVRKTSKPETPKKTTGRET